MLLLLLKWNEIKGEIPNITNLATTAALTAVENKILNGSNLVKKNNWNTTQKLVKLKIKLLMIMIMINILLLKNLTSEHQKILLLDYNKQT